MGNPVVHFEINAGNAPALHKFYADLFDWKLDVQEAMGGYGLVDTQTEGRGINGGIGPAQGDPFVTFYVEVKDLQTYLDKAESLGAKTVVPATEIPGVVTFALFTDPEGNRIGLVKEEQAAS